MKISKKDIMRIVEEEINEVGLYHSPKTGRWVSKSQGAVKSLTKKGARSAGVNPDLVGRGVVTAKDKISAKMGQNFGKDQCGRKTIDGEDITARYKCSDYKEPYSEGLINLDQSVSIREVIRAAESALSGLDEELSPECAGQRSEWLKSLLRSLNAVALASKGDLLPKKENVDKEAEASEPTKSELTRKKSQDAKRRAKTKKMRSDAGIYFPKTGFNKSERELLNTNSLWEEFCAANI